MTAEHIRKYWQLYAFAAYVIAQWIVFGNSIQDNREHILALEEKQEAEELVLLDIRTRLASIETSIKYIENNI